MSLFAMKFSSFSQSDWIFEWRLSIFLFLASTFAFCSMVLRILSSCWNVSFELRLFSTVCRKTLEPSVFETDLLFWSLFFDKNRPPSLSYSEMNPGPSFSYWKLTKVFLKGGLEPYLVCGINSKITAIIIISELTWIHVWSEVVLDVVHSVFH